MKSNRRENTIYRCHQLKPSKYSGIDKKKQVKKCMRCDGIFDLVVNIELMK